MSKSHVFSTLILLLIFSNSCKTITNQEKWNFKYINKICLKKYTLEKVDQEIYSDTILEAYRKKWEIDSISIEIQESLKIEKILNSAMNIKPYKCRKSLITHSIVLILFNGDSLSYYIHGRRINLKNYDKDKINCWIDKSGKFIEVIESFCKSED